MRCGAETRIRYMKTCPTAQAPSPAYSPLSVSSLAGPAAKRVSAEVPQKGHDL